MNWDIVTHYLLPPIIGAVIGYFTNMIAVKMLFIPHEEKRIFGHRVPFTPGAIPKGKERLAKAAGEIVQNDLFTMEDISHKMLTEEVEKPLIDKAMEILRQNIKETGAVLAGSEDKYADMEKNFSDLLSDKIIDAIKRMGIQDVIKKEGTEMLNKQISSSLMLSVIVSDNLINKIMNTVADKMEAFINGKGSEMVHDITASRIHDLGERTPLYVLDSAGYNEEYIREKITEAYRESVVNAVNAALKRIDVAEIVEDKINSMSVQELEDGVLQVMENELNMIVGLGALIGLVIGSINIFI